MTDIYWNITNYYIKLSFIKSILFKKIFILIFLNTLYKMKNTKLLINLKFRIVKNRIVVIDLQNDYFYFNI